MRLKMTERCLSDDEFVRRLSGHPELRRQMESLLLAVEDESGAHKTADAAELQIIEEMRRSGQVALQSWATRRVEETAQVAAQTDGQWSEGKKTLLAQYVWRHLRRRTPIPRRQQKNPSVRAKRGGKASWLFTPAAACSNGLWC